MKLRGQLEQLIDAFMCDVASQKKEYIKKNDFRVSAFPFCPLRAFLFEQRTDSYSMDFYTSIGTAVHETIQKWATISDFADKIYAVWQSVETGEVYGPCKQEDLPKSWDNYTLAYEEVTISYDGLSGHVDLIIEILPGKYIVIDFKTTDIGGKRVKFRSKWQDQDPASRSSIIQISSYCSLLSKIHGLNIVAWCLIYVDRGKVIQGSRDYYKVLRPWNEKKTKNMLKHIDKACANNKRLQRLRKYMEESDDYSPKAVKTLKKMVVNRPCKDEESYDAWMDYKFFKMKGPGGEGVTDGKCDLKKDCICGSKRAYKAVKARL